MRQTEGIGRIKKKEQALGYLSKRAKSTPGEAYTGGERLLEWDRKRVVI